MLPTLTLPQFDANPTAREQHLEKMRVKYAYRLTYNGQIATVNNLPKCEKPGAFYQLTALSNLLGLAPSLPGFLWKAIKYGLFKAKFKNVEDYIFFGLSPFPKPQLRTDMWNDRYVAHQAVAGANPAMIEGVSDNNPLPKTIKIKKAKLALSTEEIQQAIADNRLYMINLDMMKTMHEQAGLADGHQKYSTSPIAIYFLKDDGNLQPLGIQLDATQNTSDDNPIITPADGIKWKVARTCFMSADGAVHDLWSHAVQIHYVMESVIISSYGQLGATHPLLALLDPHLQYTLSVNVNPLYERGKDGKVPYYGRMFPPNNDTLVKFMGEGMRDFKFRERALPNDLKRRHVENPKLNYPYRDNGLPMWEEIQTFTREYVDVYYKSDQYVLDDHELQVWAKAIGGDRVNGHCGIEDFPTEFTTKQAVAETFGQIIYLSTAHHSSVHFPQYPYSQFVPNMPNAIYADPSELLKGELSQEKLMSLFPPFKIGAFQAFLYYAVNFKVSRIGEYPVKFFCPAAVGVIENHQRRLAEISAQYRDKFRNGEQAYPYMDPKHIPNSVSS